MSTNRVKSGPGPLRRICEKIEALEYEVDHLKTELRLVKKKLNSSERNGNHSSSGSVQNIIVDGIKEHQYAITLTPISNNGDSINIIQAVPTASRIKNRPENPNPRNIYVNDGIFDDEQNFVSNDDTNMLEEAGSDTEVYPNENGHEEKFNNINPIKIIPDPRERNAEDVTGSEIVEEEGTSSGEPGSPNQILETKKGRKRFDPVWNKYKVSLGPNGKREAHCRHCRQKVSAEALRLKNHLAKCEAIFGSKCVNPKAKVQKKKIISTATSDSAIQHEGEDNEDKKSGRVLDPVWNNFNISVGPNGRKYPTCKICGASVSGEARRLKNHLEKNCTGTRTPCTGNKNNRSQKQQQTIGSDDSSSSIPDMEME